MGFGWTWGEVGMVGVEWTRVYKDGQFGFSFFFNPRCSQTDRQPGTVKLMKGGHGGSGGGRGGREATEDGNGGRGRAERR